MARKIMIKRSFFIKSPSQAVVTRSHCSTGKVEVIGGIKVKIGILLSGGVDSAVALYQLRNEGYEIVAYHMKTMKDEFFLNRQIKHKICCSPSDTADAKLIAKTAGVPLKVVDLHEIFKEKIITYYLQEYARGRTPNPCYFCNRFIKFGYLMDLMIEDGVDVISSGHYARVADGKLLRALDKEKDQSYFLASIEKERLKKIVFPNGDKTKDEIRDIAKKAGIHVHSKAESQDLCFIPDGDQKRFFEEQGIKIKSGPIFDKYGKKIGEHTGLINYTIGQRKIGVSAGERVYVTRICADRNALIVGNEKDVQSDKFSVIDFNLLVDIDKNFEATVKVRKNSTEVPCKVSLENHRVIVKTTMPVFAVAPGQAAVFYRGDIVIGAGIIEKIL